MRHTILFINDGYLDWVGTVFSQWYLKATYGFLYLLLLLAPQLPGINMLRGWQLNFHLWLFR